MHRLAALVLALFASAAFAEEDPVFEKTREGSAPTEGGLSTFLSKFVGACPEEAGPSCKKAAEDYRRQNKGKKLYLSLEDATSMLQIGGDRGEGEVTMNITPFFPAGEFALTSSAPKRTDANGNPVLPLMRVNGKAPDGDVPRLGRMLSMRQLRVEVVFSPEANWALPKKGGGTIQGVAAKLHGIRVSMLRTGETVAVWTGR